MIGIRYMIMAFAALMPQAFAQNCTTIAPAAAPVWGSGYSGRVVVNGLSSPRGLLFDNQGNILTSEAGRYGVRYIQLTDNGGTDVCVKSSKQLIAETTANHGITLTPDGKTLFVSSVAEVWAWDYDGTTGTVTNKRTVVSNMRNSGHNTRTLLVPKASPDVLLVQRGSSDNIDAAAALIETGRSQIRIFKIKDILTAPVDYLKGDLLSWGLRNTVGVGEDPWGGIWSVDNGCDNMQREGKDIHQSNPCEELNYHGKINDTASPERGGHHGYPDCFAVWDPTVIPNAEANNLKVGTPFVIGTPTGNLTDKLCQERLGPKLCFPSHTAPLDIKFNANGTVAYVPFHGSWNRQPADGYRLSRIDFDPKTGLPVEPVTSQKGAVDIMSNTNAASCPSGCFRPVNVAFSPKGQLFMTSDTTNEIWVLGSTTGF